MSIITDYLSPVFLHSHLVVKAPIVSSDQLIQPVLPRENGSMLRDSVEMRAVRKYARFDGFQDDQSGHSKDM